MFRINFFIKIHFRVLEDTSKRLLSESKFYVLETFIKRHLKSFFGHKVFDFHLTKFALKLQYVDLLNSVRILYPSIVFKRLKIELIHPWETPWDT